jgi:hypothetical protein
VAPGDRARDAAGATVQALPWRVHTGSAIGAAHVRDGRPNEDAVAHQLTQLPGGPGLLVAAVADGHGDARYFRSDRGSKLAVAAGISAMQDWAATMPGDPGEIKLSARRALVPSVVARWNAAVAADMTRDEFTAAERAMLADLRLPPPTAYGSTLLIGAFTAEYAVFAQIGDGSVVGVWPDGRWVSPVPGDSRLDGTHTTSLCQADAAASFRVGVVRFAARPLYAALLATDGYGNAQAEDRWQAGVAADVARFGLEHDQDWFSAQVPDWAAQCASSAGSGDDVTIALVINSAVRPSVGPARAGSPRKPAAVTVPARTVPARSPGRPAPSGARTVPVDQRRPDPFRDRAGGEPDGRRAARRRNRVWAGAAAAAVVIAVGLVLALLLSGHGHRPVPPAPSHRPSQAVTHPPSPSPSGRAGSPRPSQSPSTPAAIQSTAGATTTTLPIPGVAGGGGHE